jgi:hypothetical protein
MSLIQPQMEAMLVRWKDTSSLMLDELQSTLRTDRQNVITSLNFPALFPQTDKSKAELLSQFREAL